MFNFHFVILCFVLLSANESYGWVFCYKNDVLESLISCLVKRGINESLEVHGLQVDEFNRRLECARQAKCTPKPSDIFDRRIRLVRKFVKCMEEISTIEIFDRSHLGKARGIYITSIDLHELEKQCREKLAFHLPSGLEHYFFSLLGISDPN